MCVRSIFSSKKINPTVFYCYCVLCLLRLCEVQLRYVCLTVQMFVCTWKLCELRAANESFGWKTIKPNENKQQKYGRREKREEEIYRSASVLCTLVNEYLQWPIKCALLQTNASNPFSFLFRTQFSIFLHRLHWFSVFIFSLLQLHSQLVALLFNRNCILKVN